MPLFRKALPILLLCVVVASGYCAEEEYSPDSIARFHINNGKFLIDQEDFLAAFAEFTTAEQMSQSPNLRAEAIAWRGQLRAVFLDDPAGAVLEYASVVEKYHESEFYKQALLQLGMLNYQLQKLEPARQWLNRFQKEFPNDQQAVTVQFLLGEIDKHIREKTLPQPPPPPAIENMIRVGLGQEPEVFIEGGTFSDPSKKREFHGRIPFTAHKGSVFSADEEIGPSIMLSSVEPLKYKGRRYHGVIELLAKGNELQVVNRLPIETYLYSVVGSEVSASWPTAALRAQAVAARTYAAYAIAHPIRQDFDLFDDVRSQAYNGVGNERDSTRSAVDETAGEVLEYNQRPILAYFMANNGGSSASSKDAFDVDLPYLRVQADNFSKVQPLGRWERHITAEQMHDALLDFGFRLPPITDVRIASTDDSGRARLIEVISGSSSIRMRCRNQFRVALNRYLKEQSTPENIPDTLLTIARKADTYTLTGGGWGHGVGMSQQGARARAEAGQDYRTILAAYYPGTVVAKSY
jgi:stage II sporulation protein D